MRQRADFFGDHAQLLEIDQTIHARVVAQMNECQVLLDHWEVGNLQKTPQPSQQLHI